MESIHFVPLYSRQGKATTHMHPNLYFGPRLKPKAQGSASFLKKKEVVPSTDKQKLTSSFKAVSREQYQHAHRNKTGSPHPARYSPRDKCVSPREDRSPRFFSLNLSPKKRRLFLPKCVDTELNCNRLRVSSRAYNKAIKREEVLEEDYDSRLNAKEDVLPVKPGHRLIGVRDFNKVKQREPFVKESDPPHEKRFDFNDGRTFRAHTVDFKRATGRNELFKTGLTIEPYDRKEETVIPRLNLLVPSFDKTPARKTLALEHINLNVHQVSVDLFDQAFNQQSHVRGLVKTPRFETKTPRDDSMYKTTEAYAHNVSQRQSASVAPKFNSSFTSRLSKFSYSIIE